MVVSAQTSLLRATAILISRFLIDLQAVNQRSLRVGRDDPLYTSETAELTQPGTASLVISRFDFIGSIGGVLQAEEQDNEESSGRELEAV